MADTPFTARRGLQALQSSGITGSLEVTTAVTSSGLQVANIDYPTSDGTNGQVVTTNGNGQLSFTTIQGGTDTNIANTDLTATADRTLKMGTNNLTISASQHLIYTNGGEFQVDARNGNFRVKSDIGHFVYIEGLPNTETPNIVGYDPTNGRLSYYDTGSFASGGSTTYTPKAWYITNNQTYTTNGTLIKTNSSILLNGTTPVTRSTTADGTFSFGQAGWYEVTYSFVVQNNFAGRANVGARCNYDTGAGEVNLAGSYSTAYLRYNTYGRNGHAQATFYVYTTGYSTNSVNNLKIYTHLLEGSMNMTTLSVPHNAIFFRYLGA